MLFKPIIALHMINFSSCRNYWGGGHNDMFAPPPIFSLGGGGGQDRRLCFKCRVLEVKTVNGGACPGSSSLHIYLDQNLVGIAKLQTLNTANVTNLCRSRVLGVYTTVCVCVCVCGGGGGYRGMGNTPIVYQ